MPGFASMGATEVGNGGGASFGIGWLLMGMAGVHLHSGGKASGTQGAPLQNERAVTRPAVHGTKADSAATGIQTNLCCSGSGVFVEA